MILLSDIASKLTVYSNSGSIHKADQGEDEDEDKDGNEDGDATHTQITPHTTHEVSENDQMHIINILEDLLCGNRNSREDEHYSGHTVTHKDKDKNTAKNDKKMKIWTSTITSEHFFTILETLKGHKKVNNITFLFLSFISFRLKTVHFFDSYLNFFICFLPYPFFPISLHTFPFFFFLTPYTSFYLCLLCISLPTFYLLPFTVFAYLRQPFPIYLLPLTLFAFLCLSSARCDVSIHLLLILNLILLSHVFNRLF